MADHPKTCIFCQTGKPTKEHVWGRWLKGRFPRNVVNYRKLVATRRLTHSEHETKIRGGDPRSLSVRCACESCNNGWMSRLQEEAAPIVTPMAMGKSCVLDALSQLSVATWATMAAMTAEYSHPQNVAISQNDRASLRSLRHPPQSCRIWIGHLPPSTWRPNYVHHPIGIVETDAEALAHWDRPVFNHAASTQVIEQLFVHVMSGLPEIIRKWTWDREISTCLRQIWPLQSVRLEWPPKPLIARRAEVIASAFFNHCGDAGARAVARRQGRRVPKS
jgi:hypothetical protein